jgi:flagellar assembly protein FliH
MSGFVQRQRVGSVLSEPSEAEFSEPIFGAKLPGSGEAKGLELPQAAPNQADEPLDPRNLALMLRPERYEERVARQQSALSEREEELQSEHQKLAQRDAELAAREEAVLQREAELENLVLSAVEERVEALADERLSQDRTRLVGSVTQLEAVAHGLLDQARLDLLELAVKIAAKVVGAELQARPQLLVGLIRSALESAAPTGQVTLHLHPKDHALLSARGPQVLGRLPAGIQIQLAADESVDRGGVVIASNAGRVDATIANRLKRIGAQLAELAEG